MLGMICVESCVIESIIIITSVCFKTYTMIPAGMCNTNHRIKKSVRKTVTLIVVSYESTAILFDFSFSDDCF